MTEQLKKFLLKQHHLSVEILTEINAICQKLSIPFVLIGAQARDLVLTGQYGISHGSTTIDIDFAIMVQDWDELNNAKEELINHDFKPVEGTEHKFLFKDYPIDIVPFGKIENNGQIAWPPDNDPEMNVVGFQEMYENAQNVIIDDNLTFKVATLAGLAMIKLIAWDDRKGSMKKDGDDFALIIVEYADAGNFDRLYEGQDSDIILKDGFDIELAGAQLLGRDISRIADEETKTTLLTILDEELSGDEEMLIDTVSSYYSNDYDRTIAILQSFKEGIQFQP